MTCKPFLVVGAIWAFAAAPVTADGGAVFSTPLPPGPGVFVPSGSCLTAPTISPLAALRGGNLFEVTPAGFDRESFLTRQPGRYVNNSCDNPVACSADRVGWLSAEFLYWATQGPSAPPIVTSGPAAVPAGIPAGIGAPGTQYLLGGARVLNRLRPGLRIEGGVQLDDEGKWAVSHRVFYMGSLSDRVVGGSDGTGVVNLPQVVPIAGIPTPVPMYVGFPGLTRGTVTASAQTNLLGGDTNLRRVLQAGDSIRVDVLGGYRFIHLGDSISDSFDIVSANLPAAASPRLMGEDSIRTRNDFHGGNMGFAATGRAGRFTLEVQSSIALGVTVSDLDQSRTRALFGTAGLPNLPRAGLAALGPPVLASHNQTDYFAVVPEVGVKFGWQPIEHLRITAGYNFLYWSQVRRAQEIDTLSAAQRNQTTDFWAQGLSLGMELRY